MHIELYWNNLSLFYIRPMTRILNIGHVSAESEVKNRKFYWSDSKQFLSRSGYTQKNIPVLSVLLSGILLNRSPYVVDLIMCEMAGMTQPYANFTENIHSLYNIFRKKKQAKLYEYRTWLIKNTDGFFFVWFISFRFHTSKYKNIFPIKNNS